MNWKSDSIFSLYGAAGMGDILQFTRLPEYYYRDFGKAFILHFGDIFGIFETLRDVEILGQPQLNPSYVYPWNDAHKDRPPGSPPYMAVRQYTDCDYYNLKPVFGNKLVYPRPNFNEIVPKFDNRRIRICVVPYGAKNRVGGEELGLTREIPDPILLSIVEELKNDCYFFQLGLKILEPLPIATKYLNKVYFDCRDEIPGPLHNTYSYMKWCDYYLGVNTGLMHLAAAANMKILMYTQTEVPKDFHPLVSEKFLKKYPIYKWMYADNQYIGHRDMGQVVHFKKISNLIKER